MNKLLTCRYNMDTNQMEARFEDGTTLAIDCIAVEDEYGNTPAQRAELDWLLYNKPLEYAQMVLGGRMERYLSLGCDHGNRQISRRIKKHLWLSNRSWARDVHSFGILHSWGALAGKSCSAQASSIWLIAGAFRRTQSK